MHPEVIASLVAFICNLVLGMSFVLGIPFRNFNGWGFTACPIVTCVVVWFQFLVLWECYRWFRKKDPSWIMAYGDISQASTSSTGCLSRFSSCMEGITMARLRTFSGLYFPAALALASDFWRMGVIGAMAATLGEREVGLFNASYRILWITLIFVGAISGAAGIKIGLRLGDGDAMGSRQAGAVGIFLAFVVLVFLSVIVYCNMRSFGMVFTNNEDYLDLFEEVRGPFAATLFFMNLAVGIETIPLSMGRTGSVFYSGFVASWFGECSHCTYAIILILDKFIFLLPLDNLYCFDVLVFIRRTSAWSFPFDTFLEK